jgi:hypothetical protein
MTMNPVAAAFCFVFAVGVLLLTAITVIALLQIRTRATLLVVSAFGWVLAAGFVALAAKAPVIYRPLLNLRRSSDPPAMVDTIATDTSSTMSTPDTASFEPSARPRISLTTLREMVRKRELTRADLLSRLDRYGIEVDEPASKLIDIFIAAQGQALSTTEFADAVRAKYPEYADVKDDEQLKKSVLAKYPEYQLVLSQVTHRYVPGKGLVPVN